MRTVRFLPVFLVVFLFFVSCSDKPRYTVDKLEITSVTRSYPDKEDWLRIVSGRIFVRFDEVPDHASLERLEGEVGVSMFVYTKGSSDPSYFLDYIAGEPNAARIAKPYAYEKSGQASTYVAPWELTEIYFGDQEFNDTLYEAIAVASDTTALKKLAQTTEFESLLNLPNVVGARLVFSDPFEVDRGSPETESEEELEEPEPDSLTQEGDLENMPAEEDSLDQPSDSGN